MNLSYWIIFFKLIIGLMSVSFVINLSGKGNLAPTSASDQIQNYVLGGIIGGIIYSPNISVLQFMSILLIWTAVILLIKWLKTQNKTFKKVMDGEPVTIIDKGILDVGACRKNGLTAHDISFKLRSNNVYNIKSVKRAILEQNGQIIIVLSGEENPKYPIITDGIIQTGILESMDKDKEWLIEKLNEKGIENASSVFLAEYSGGELNIIPY